MKIQDLMEAYQNGQMPAVQGPLDFLQALAVVQMNRKLIDTLKAVIDSTTEQGSSMPLAARAKVHYEACVLIIEAEQL